MPTPVQNVLITIGAVAVGGLIIAALNQEEQDNDGDDGFDPLWEVGEHVVYIVDDDERHGVIVSVHTSVEFGWVYDIGTDANVPEADILRLFDDGGNGDGNHAVEPPASIVESTVNINADPSEDAYDIIGEWLPNIEAPDLFGDHTSFRPHITQQASGGPHGGPFFRFHIHPQDRDRGSGSRSRNEVSSNTSSEDEVIFRSGDIGRIHWFMRTNPNYDIANDDYVMQLHATGGGPQAPIVKLILDARRDPDALNITHQPNNDPDVGPEVSLAQVPFSQIRGHWLELEVIARFTNTGRLIYRIWLPNGQRIINIDRNLDMFHAQILRPKFGIYRPRGEGSNDFVDFADWRIQKLTQIP
jgi:hypothetical protein